MLRRLRQAVDAEKFAHEAHVRAPGELHLFRTVMEAVSYTHLSQIYPVRAAAAAVLPPGHFQLTKTGGNLRLAWTPDGRSGVGAIVREITVK